MPGTLISNPPLSVAILGSGLGGLSAAIALRRQGHTVTIFERYDFGNEVGASLSCASNGSRFLEEWGVAIPDAKPVILKSLIMHEWKTGEITGQYGLGDYREKFGTDYNNFHRIDLHRTLKETATAEAGDGPACALKTWHKAVKVEPEEGRITFENGNIETADVIIAADGIRSLTRPQLGIVPHFDPSTSCCYRCIIPSSRLRELGLERFITSDAIEFWGGFDRNKIVMSSCSNYDVVSCYCFYPAEYNDLEEDGWNISTTGENLCNTFKDLDPDLHKLFLNADDIKMWRLYVHQPYSHWVKGRVALLGDAAHPMLPDQSQGACMAIEDAGALGILFSETYAALKISEKLRLYEIVRKERASRVQAASAKARTDLSERIGWSSKADRPGKLTIEEICGYDMHQHVAEIVSQQ